MAQIKWTSVLYFESQSSDKRHEVKRHPNTGKFGCSCTAFKFQKLPVNERECKHTRTARTAFDALVGKNKSHMDAALRELQSMGATDSN